MKNIQDIVKRIENYINSEEFSEKKTDEIKEEITAIISDSSNEVFEQQLKYYQENLIEILKNFNEEYKRTTLSDTTKPMNTKRYSELIYTKLNYLFRRNDTLTYEEKYYLYNNEYEFTKNKINLFLDLVNWIGDNGIPIISEKTLFSAYLGVSIETYNQLLKSASSEEIRDLFIKIDEYFTTAQFGALITNNRKNLERIQRIETYGQEMKSVQRDSKIAINVINEKKSYTDIMQEIASAMQKRNVIETKGKE